MSKGVTFVLEEDNHKKMHEQAKKRGMKIGEYLRFLITVDGEKLKEDK